MEVAAMRSASVLSFSFYFNGKENSMTKFAILGAAVVSSLALAEPAIAQHSVANPSYIVETGVCPGHEAGNPYTEREDYIAWSAWRAKGGWDDHNDLNCLRVSHFRQRQAGF
jgi:hypothetical protein